MNKKKQDFTHFLKEEHYGKWLAVSRDFSKILGSSENLGRLTSEFKKKKVIFTRAENPQSVYAFVSVE